MKTAPPPKPNSDKGKNKRAESLLAENRLLHSMMENLQLLAVILDPGGRVIYCNDYLLNLTGWQRAEVIDANWFDIFVAKTRRDLRQRFEEILKSGELSPHYERPIVTKSGATRLIKWNNTVMRGDNGEVTGVASIGEDVTEKRRAEEQLRKSNERLQVFFHQSLDGFFFCHFDQPREWRNAQNKDAVLEDIINTQHFSDVNDAMLKQYQISRADFLKLTTRDVFAHDLDQGRRLRRALFDQGRLHLETSERKVDGTPVWFEGDYVCLYDTAGRVTGFFGIQRDITDRKESEIALRTAEEKFRSIFENAVDGIYQSSPEGRFITVNPTFARMLGYDSPQEVIESITDIAGQIYGDAAFRTEFMRQMAEKGSVIDFEYQRRRKDGSLTWTAENARAVRDAAGRVVYYEGIVEDITKRKEAEDALIESEWRNRLVAELATDHTFIVDVSPQGTLSLRWVSENIRRLARRFTDKPLDMFIWKKLIHREHASPFLKFIRELLESGSAGAIECRTSEMGGQQWIEISAQPLRNDAGAIHVIVGAIKDVTERKQHEQRIEKQLQKLNALHAIDNAINAGTDLHTTLEILLKEAAAQLKADAAAVLLYNKHTLMLDYAASHGFRPKVAQHLGLSLNQGCAGQAILERKLIHLPDLKVRNHDMAAITGRDFAAYAGMPLIAKGQAVGVLEIFSYTTLTADRDWLDFLEMLAGQTAIAINNAQLFENLQRSNFELTLAYDATIEGWSRALDLRDEETEGHTQRVTNLTLELARRVGIPEAEMLHIRRGALLHDIGKMGIPDRILRKPDSLTEEEWAVMRRHTVYAHEMLMHIPYLRPALDIPRYHHEKWDGSGYPHGLRGEGIPISARIFSVVDVWDALTSDRPYRKAWSKEKAIAHIMAESGKHFDPKVVDTFLMLIEHQ